MDESQYPALKTELTTNPQGYPYGAITPARSQQLADELNRLRDGTNGGPAINIPRADIAPLELFNVIDVRDFGGSPGVLGGAWFQSLMREQRIPLLDAAGQPNLIKQNLDRYIQNGNGSQTRLDAISRRRGSRAEQLGFGRVEKWDVERALALP